MANIWCASDLCESRLSGQTLLILSRLNFHSIVGDYFSSELYGMVAVVYNYDTVIGIQSPCGCIRYERVGVGEEHAWC